MARSKRKPFDAAGPFVVRRRFLYDGQWTVPGEAFDFEKCGARRTRQLWDNRQIDVGEPTVKRLEPRIPSHEKDIEKRISAMTEWRSMNRIALIDHCETVTGIKCTSKKHAIEVMEEWEANQ